MAKKLGKLLGVAAVAAAAAAGGVALYNYYKKPEDDFDDFDDDDFDDDDFDDDFSNDLDIENRGYTTLGSGDEEPKTSSEDKDDTEKDKKSESVK